MCFSLLQFCYNWLQVQIRTTFGFNLAKVVCLGTKGGREGGKGERGGEEGREGGKRERGGEEREKGEGRKGGREEREKGEGGREGGSEGGKEGEREHGFKQDFSLRGNTSVDISIEGPKLT